MNELLVIRDSDLPRNIYDLVAGLYNDKVLSDDFMQAGIEEERAHLGVQRSQPLSDVIDWSFLRNADGRR